MNKFKELYDEVTDYLGKCSFFGRRLNIDYFVIGDDFIVNLIISYNLTKKGYKVAWVQTNDTGVWLKPDIFTEYKKYVESKLDLNLPTNISNEGWLQQVIERTKNDNEKLLYFPSNLTVRDYGFSDSTHKLRLQRGGNKDLMSIEKPMLKQCVLSIADRMVSHLPNVFNMTYVSAENLVITSPQPFLSGIDVVSDKNKTMFYTKNKHFHLICRGCRDTHFINNEEVLLDFLKKNIKDIDHFIGTIPVS